MKVDIVVSERFQQADASQQHKALHEAAHVTMAALCPGCDAMSATMLGGQTTHGRDLASYSITPSNDLNTNQLLKLRTFVAIAPRCFFIVLAGQNGSISVDNLGGCDADFLEIHVEHFVYLINTGVRDVQDMKARALSVMDGSQGFVIGILLRHIQAVYSVADALLTNGQIETEQIRAIVEPLRKDNFEL